MDKSIRHMKTEDKLPGVIIINRITDVVFSLAEIILAFRLAFRLLGANPGNGFVRVLYAVTKPVVSLFSGIFDNIKLGGDSPERVLELDTILAIIVIAIIAWAIQRLIYPRIQNRTERIEYSGPVDQSNDNQPKV